MQQRQKVKDIKTFNILITGDSSYNNIDKFNTIMHYIYQTIDHTKTIGTFGERYGAQVLAQLYAQSKYTNFKEFTVDMFKKSTKPRAQLYHVLLGIGVKWADLVVVFSNVYNKKLTSIINACKRELFLVIARY